MFSIDAKFEICWKKLYATDVRWQKRKRKINTAAIFSNISDASATKRGFDHLLLKQESDYTSQALGLARKKLPDHVFLDINKSIHDETHNTCSQIYAIDGSKIHVHPSFLKKGCTTRTNNVPVPRPAKRPLVMLSSLFNVNSQTCYHSHISQHFNERKSAEEHFSVLKPGDTVLFDRGYYSKDLLASACSKNIRVLFRLKRTAFRAANTFWNSNKTTCNMLYPLSEDGRLVKITLVKYFIDGHKYMNLINFEANILEIKDLYAKRWGVETSFRRLKTNLNLECSHSMTPELYCQEIEARILLDTICQEINKCVDKKNKKSKTYFQILDVVLDVLYIVANTSLPRLQIIITSLLENRKIYPNIYYNTPTDRF